MRSLLEGLSVPQRVIAAVLAVAVVAAGAAWAVAGGSASPTPSPEPSASPTPEATATSTVRPTPSPTAVPTPEPTPVAVCPLNGLALADASVLDRTALAVQIENHPAARPARNLSHADMVYEATVEGDITRFTAIYLCQPTEGLTGPIRSARYYNIDLWQDVGFLTVGYGASNGALDRFARAGMPYVNGITGAWPWYTRYGPKPAPHNLYGDIEAVRAALGNNAALDRLAAQVHALRPPLSFDAAAVQPAGRAISAVEIRTNPYWRIGWRWVAAEAKWQRLDAGVEIMDEATGEPVMATSVLVQLVTEEVVYGDPDPAGNPRRLHHLVGSGHGVLYVGGQAIDVNWSRPSADAGTTWTYASSGEPLLLPPGVVWWEIAPLSSSIAETAR